MSEIKRRGVAMVVSAASGAGKTTLCQRLVAEEKGVSMSVSCTTRSPREGERDGVDYHFMTHEAFDTQLAQGGFFEWAQVHGEKYGTLAPPLEEKLVRGEDVLLAIDVQGGQQMLKRMPEVVLVFLLPPSAAELERRLRTRASDEDEQIEKRLKWAAHEAKEAMFYTYWVVNDDLAHSSDALRSILCSERLRRRDKAALFSKIH